MANEMQTFTLTGDGATGILPEGAPEFRGIVEAMPVTVKLGRKAPKSRPQVPRLAEYVNSLAAVPIPISCDWFTKAASAIARMYRNNALGCCVFSGKFHNLGIWPANDTDAGPIVLATDDEVQSQYFAYTGGRDDGAIISEVLDIFRDKGLTAGGQKYKIKGYVSCDWRSKELTQIGMTLFGPGSIGFNLPGSWMNANVWDTSNAGSIAGGHDVSPCGYDPAPGKIVGITDEGVVVSSWGRLYLFTWRAWQSNKWIDELYFMVPENLWTGIDGRAPSGVNLADLLTDLTKIGGGDLPPLPDPNPPGPNPPGPNPPNPPVPVNLTVAIPALVVRLWGLKIGATDPTTVPVSAGFRAGAVDWWVIAADAGKLFTDAAAGAGIGVLVADVWKLVQDLGLIAKARGFAPVVPVREIVMDALAFFAAVASRNWPAAITALLKLAADFGLSFTRKEAERFFTFGGGITSEIDNINGAEGNG